MVASPRQCRRIYRRSSRVARTAESAEDLSADRIVPVPESVANGTRPGRPRAAPQHFVLCPKKFLGVLLVWKRLETRIGAEIARRPFPHVADHSVTTNRRNVPLVASDRGGAKSELIDVCGFFIRPRIAPRVSLRPANRRVPRRGCFPLEFGGQALARPAREGVGLVVADVANR